MSNGWHISGGPANAHVAKPNTNRNITAANRGEKRKYRFMVL
jgi:hypothetical protein